jgi:cytochrome oxidase assembly protein ShyY1
MSFLLSRRWLQYIAFALVAAIVCLLLANWQDHRRANRDAEIDRIEAHYSAQPVPLSTVLPATDAPFAEDDEWTRVEATGEYRPEDATVARNRPKNGSAGYWIVVPFDVDGGGTLLVARGWSSGSGADATAAEAPAPPTGAVTLTAWLRPAQAGDPAENTETSVVAIDPALLEGDGAYAHAYGYLDSEDPAPAQSLEALPEPNTDPGSHLSYTFQWIAFAVMILVGVAYAAKRERDAVRRGERDDAIAHDRVVPGVEYEVVDKEALLRGGTRRSPAASQRPAPRPVLGMRRDARALTRSQRRADQDEDAALDAQLNG